MRAMKAVVVMPTYNEASNLPMMVQGLLALGLDGLHLLVVDDSSPDGTGEIADDMAAAHPGFMDVIHRSGKQGLGTAYVAGFRWALAAGADYIIEMDADFSHPLEALSRFMEAIQRCDVVVGSRYASGGGVDPRWSWRRKLLSRLGNLYAQWVTGLDVQDVTAGFKCFRREVLERLDLSRVRSNGYAFQVEMAYACHKKGFRVREVPIQFLDRTYGSSKMSLAIVWEALWRVWEIR
ncbi:MAG: putative glycosyltransferase, partial [Dehalococcoidia bacterium]|nr:putative glycosyltransferase [Dehalococcoidia bacterium]